MTTTAVTYQTQAARDAVRLYGADYADYIEQSTLEHIERGYLTREVGLSRSLGAAFAGNDGE